MLADPVSAFFGATLLVGLGLVVGLMVQAARADDLEPPAPIRPAPTVLRPRPVEIGTCAMCGTEGVPIRRRRPHLMLDPMPLCDECGQGHR